MLTVKLIKNMGKLFLLLTVAILILIPVCYVNHRIQLNKVELKSISIGQKVAVNGRLMNVYSEGTGNNTLVFMSGAGTSSPVLDFKSLYSILSSHYKIVVVEKAGYGFSEDADVPRDIDTILSETRKALSRTGATGPYVLVPHSMSGIEALYWSQQFPEEVTAIIGLDMAVPMAYSDMNINMQVMQFASFAANIGLTRWIPGLSESDAIKHGTLTEEEKEIYRTVFYHRTATKAMLNEAAEVKANADKVNRGNPVTAPVLMFTSNGIGVNIEDGESWSGFQQSFADNLPNATILTLDCPHYVHNYKYMEIATEVQSFLTELTQESK